MSQFRVCTGSTGSGRRLAPVLQGDGRELHGHLLLGGAVVACAVGEPDDPDVFHRDRQVEDVLRAAAIHLQLRLGHRDLGDQRPQQEVRRRVVPVRPVERSRPRFTRATAAAETTRYGFHLPVPGVHLDPLLVALAQGFAVGAVEEGKERIHCHRLPPERAGPVRSETWEL